MRLDDVTGAVTRVIIRHSPAPAVRAALNATARLVGGCVLVLDEFPEPLPILDAWFDSIGAVGAVVRPDHVVFGTERDADGVLPLVNRFVDAITCPTRQHRRTPTNKDTSP